MKRMMVRYRVRPGHATENLADIRRVFEELHAAHPAGFRYASFTLDDGVSFVHVVAQDDDNAASPLRDLPAFQAFQAAIKARCEEAPVVTPLHEVGAYRS